MYQIDELEFYKDLARRESDERGRYIVSVALQMIDGTLDLPWAKRISTKPTQVRKPKNQGYTEAFETFWKHYPNKVGKGAAFKSWTRLTLWAPSLEATLLADCLGALIWQKESDSWKQDNGKYIPHPQTYLNQRRWEDEPPAQKVRETYIDMDGVQRER